VKRKGQIIRNRLEKLVSGDPEGIFTTRGRGMIQALDCKTGELATMITTVAFDKGVIIETSGSDGEVIKFLMPLTITEEQLNRGLNILEESVKEVMGGIRSRLSGESEYNREPYYGLKLSSV
jgi:diaminobutyrate-2-oxoglutarate transaminase